MAQHNQVYHSDVGKLEDFNRGKRKFALVDESVISGRNCGGSIFSDIFNSEESNRYFTNDQKDGNGAYHLVANALFGTENISSSMSTDDVTLHLVIARFVKSLSRVQRVEFAFILEILLEKYSNDNNATKNVEEQDENICNNGTISRTI